MADDCKIKENLQNFNVFHSPLSPTYQITATLSFEKSQLFQKFLCVFFIQGQQRMSYKSERERKLSIQIQEVEELLLLLIYCDAMG